MASRRPRPSTRRKPLRSRVKVAPFVVPTRRGSVAAAPLMVPTKWVKFVVALFLLPACVLLSQTFFTSFARATLTERLWAGEEFWSFSLGVILWLIAFFGLPRPLLIYVFAHELTHALWVWMMGGRVSHFRVSRDGGHILTDKNNFLIALAPYFFPLYSLMVLALYGAWSLFMNVQPYGRILYALVGVTWAFHLTFTCWMIPKNQSDLADNGTIFSLVVIYLMNLLLLSALLVIVSPRITFENFGADVVRNVANFSHTVVSLCESFSRGAP
ncbi:MAG: hypothetical protein ACR2G0_06685 [Chthoniobacterales bacterium]